MSDHSEGPAFEQPASFEFTPENMERAKYHIAKYPPGRQARLVIARLIGGYDVSFESARPG